MKIAMISYYYLPEYSGSAKQAANLIRKLNKRDIDCFVISAKLNPEWIEFEKIEGIQIFRVYVNPKHVLLSFWFGVAKILWKMRHEYDIVHSHGLNPFHGFPLFWGKLLGKPTLGKLSIADSDINFKNQGRLFGRIHRWFLMFADRYIAISTALKNELSLSGLPENKCRLIPNGVDTEVFHPADDINVKLSNGFNPNKKKYLNILFVGVIDIRKGVDILIPAFIEVLKKVQNVRLSIVGPINRDDKGNRFYNEMKNLVKNNATKNKIEFYNYAPRIVDYYQKADIFVLPSRQEGMPNVVIEAMACGLPIIGTKISGTEDLIDEGINGIIIPPDDQKSLIMALLRLIKDRELRKKMGIQSMKKIQKHYSLDIIADQYVNIYQDIIRQGN